FLTLILLVFYIAVFQIYSSLTIFIQHYVARSVMRWEIPIAAFASLQCIFFIMCAPIVDRSLKFLSKKGFVLSLLTKISIGLFIGSLAFLSFGISEQTALQAGTCGISWIVLGNFFLGMA